MSRDLIRLKTDVEVPASAAGYSLGERDEERLRRIYTELGFTSLLKELDSSASAIPTNDFHVVADEAALRKMLKSLGDAPLLVIDTETTSLQSRKASLVGISLNGGGDDCWYIPLGHLDQQGKAVAGQLPAEQVRQELSELLTSATLPKLAHNLKYDYSVLKHAFGVELAGPLYDTMIAAYLAEPSRRSFKLDDLCLELGLKLTSYKEVTDGDKREDGFAYVDIGRAAAYSCEDVFATLQLWNHYRPLLDEGDQEELFGEVEMKLVPILEQMEADGIRIDPAHLERLSAEFREKLDQRETEIYELAGREFNINSPQQLGVPIKYG